MSERDAIGIYLLIGLVGVALIMQGRLNERLAERLELLENRDYVRGRMS